MHANDNLSLLATIRHHPEDDDARLVYADWLDDQGDETRAEFIRLQVADPVELAPCLLHRVGHPCESPFSQGVEPPVDPSRRRQIQLYRKYVRKWNGAIHRRLRGTRLAGQIDSRRGLVRGWSYRRGFPCTVWAKPDAFASYPEAILALGPLDRLNLVGPLIAPTLRLVLEKLKMSRVRTVELIQSPLPADCASLLSNREQDPWLSRLAWILQGMYYQSTR